MADIVEASEPEKEYYASMSTEALRKRLEHWRSVAARAAGQRNAVADELRERAYAEVLAKAKTVHTEAPR